MPIQVIGRSIDGEKFREICQTQDASAFGLCFVLQSIVERGAVLYLSMRMPRRLRLFDLAKDIYQVYAQVQRVQLLSQGGCEVGVSFIGRNPPPGVENYQTLEYLGTDLKVSNSGANKISSGAYPMATVDSSPQPTSDVRRAPIDEIKPPVSAPLRTAPAPPPAAVKPPMSPGAESSSKKATRRDARHQIPIDVAIEFLDASGKIVHKEPGLITNISRSGACVMSTRVAQVGSRLIVVMTREDFTAQASVKAVTSGQGGVWNLHLEFLDKCWMGEI
jgi:hypothetical protein